MDTIAKHASKLVLQYCRKINTDTVVISAKRLAKFVLSASSLLSEHRKLVLSRLQWFISEADGKYRTRYRSRTVVGLATLCPNSPIKINHDHVHTRQEITKRLLAEPSRSDEILDDVIGCIVTKDEHSKLYDACSGWQRYEGAGVEILDMSFTPPQLLCFSKLENR